MTLVMRTTLMGVLLALAPAAQAQPADVFVTYVAEDWHNAGMECQQDFDRHEGCKEIARLRDEVRRLLEADFDALDAHERQHVYYLARIIFTRSDTGVVTLLQWQRGREDLSDAEKTDIAKTIRVITDDEPETAPPQQGQGVSQDGHSCNVEDAEQDCFEDLERDCDGTVGTYGTGPTGDDSIFISPGFWFNPGDFDVDSEQDGFVIDDTGICWGIVVQCSAECIPATHR